MPSVPIRLKTGPATATAVETITGGQLVEARTGGVGVGVAAAGSVKCLGVALDDATLAGTITTPVTVSGHPQLAAVVVPNKVAIAHGGAVVPVTFAAAAVYGQLLKCAAAGQVTPYVSGTDDASLIVARCVAVAGVGSGLVGDARILV